MTDTDTQAAFTAAPKQVCIYCGNLHETMCPRISVISYYPDGTLKEVHLQPMPSYPKLSAAGPRP